MYDFLKINSTCVDLSPTFKLNNISSSLFGLYWYIQVTRMYNLVGKRKESVIPNVQGISYLKQ